MGLLGGAMSGRGSARTGRSSHPATGRTTLRGKQDKQHRLKGFLIQKVRERNAIDGQDPNTLRILNEEADRMLCQPASEAELRKAEVRILNRLRGTPAPPASGRSSNCHTNRSAISHASDALGAYYDRSNPGSQRSSQASSRMGSSRAPSSRRSAMGDPLQNQDYWLKFTQMDVDNYQTEERRRAEEAMRVKKANSKYLDAQVNLKNRAQEASKLADKQWKQEVTKDYNRWQEENIVLEAREKKKRAEYVADTDDICNKAEALRLSEQAKDRKFDMEQLARIKEEMMRDKDKQEAKKFEEKKVVELMKMQLASEVVAKQQKKDMQAKEEKRMAKEYGKILQRQAEIQASQQKKFQDKIKATADRLDEYTAKEAAKQGAAAAADADSEMRMIEQEKENYKNDMIRDANNAEKKKEAEKKMFRDSLNEQMAYKNEEKRLAAEEKAAMRNLKKELALAAEKDESKEMTIKAANFRNKKALDMQIQQKKSDNERGRWMNDQEREMNMNLIVECDKKYG